MGYTVTFRSQSGQTLGRPHVYLHKESPWTLDEVVRHVRNDFMPETEATSLDVRDEDGRLIVELTRAQFDAGAKQYKVAFVEVPQDRREWNPTGQVAYFAAWSQPLAMALAKELVPLYPPATGFDLIDMISLVPLEGWDRSQG